MVIMWGLTPPGSVVHTSFLLPICVVVTWPCFKFLQAMGRAPFLLQGLCASCSLTQEHHLLSGDTCLLLQVADSSALSSFLPISVHATPFILYDSSHPPLLLLLLCLSQLKPTSQREFPAKFPNPVLIKHPSSQRPGCKGLTAPGG